LEKINEMLDFFIDSEHGQAEILQISGGEPTLHPQIFDIIELARTKKIKYIFLNTNGLRLAKDERFAEELGRFKGGFEIYLQFDGLSEKSALAIRGRNVVEDRQRAVANLSKHHVPITLVATVVRGVNDDQIGEVFNYAIGEEWIRGINYQPVAFFGRLPEGEDIKNRITMTGILKTLEIQTKGMVKLADFIPLPCDVERVAISYLFKQKGELIPLIRDIDIKQFLPAIRNTFQFAPDKVVKEIAETLDKKGNCCQIMGLFKDLKKTVLPPNYLLMSQDQKAEFINNNTFRISATSFVDKYNFDAKSMQKECVHIITPDLKKIPFSAYNMIHRYAN
jgi:Predicted Fe-S oxidoreductases